MPVDLRNALLGHPLIVGEPRHAGAQRLVADGFDVFETGGEFGVPCVQFRDQGLNAFAGRAQRRQFVLRMDQSLR